MNNYVAQIYSHEKNTWGLPQTYKGIEFYPVKIGDAQYVNLFYRVFAYPKNYIADRTILRMSYLKYLLYVVQASIDINGNEVEKNLISFLKYCTKTEHVALHAQLGAEDMVLENLILTISIDDKVLTENDFENIRELVLEQNGIGIDYIEEYNPELESKMRIFNNSLTFEDELLTFCALTNKLIHEIADYTLFQFKKHLERILILKEFDLYKPLEASGQIKLKNGEIKHYLSSIEKQGRYASILIDKDTYIKSGDVFQASQQ